MIVEAPVFERTQINSFSQEPQRSVLKPVELASGLVVNPRLREAKFDVLMEMNRFISDINIGLDGGRTLFDAVRGSTKTLEIHVRGYDREIVKSKVVLPHLNRFGEKNDEIRMLGSSGEPVVNSISERERKGAVLEGSIAVENNLLAAPNNSAVVLMSPSGWNDFVDAYGRDASPHQNSQTMIFWKDEVGALKGLTLHTDLDRRQAKEVMQSLGVSYEGPEEKGEKEEIVDIVRNPALLSLPHSLTNPFEYVLDKILAQRGQDAFRLTQQDGTVEVRPIEQVRADIKRFDSLLGGNLEEEMHIAELKNLILSNVEGVNQRDIQQEIIYRIEKTILELTRTYLQNNAQRAVYESGGRSQLPDILYTRDPNNFDREIAFLKTRAGCPPGVTALAGMSSGEAALLSGTSSAVLKDKDFCIKCGACGEVILRVVRHGQKCPKCPAVRQC